MAESGKTMRVKLNSSRAGDVIRENKLAGSFVQNIGQEVEMPADEARRYIERGLASEVTTKGNSNKD